jgi:hypothetical protein
MKIYRRVTNKRYCTGYKNNNHSFRNVVACANYIRKVNPEARYFFFRHEGNFHCAACPLSYRGGNAGTAYQNSRIYVYRILNWRPPVYTWAKWYRRVAFNRFCHGYKDNNYKFRKVEDCGSYIRRVNPDARYFFFREEGNYHCASCPASYRGGNAGTGKQNSRIYTYRILNWRPPAYLKKYQRVALNRYCTGYKKSNMKHRTIYACANWVRSVDREARYFFFRHEGNYHCSPCPLSYRGGNAGTAKQNSRIYVYRIIGWTRPVYSWAKWYRRVAFNRFCHGYTNNNFKLRTVEACGRHVRAKDPYARYFFFREEGNYHCASCPWTYKGGNTGTGKQNSRIYTYQILRWREPTFRWSKWYKRVALRRYCKGYKRSAYNHRTVENCGRWVRTVDPYARFFFFREQSNWHCAPCPASYRGGNAGTGYQKSNIFTYRILNWRTPTYSWSRWYKRVAFNRYCHGYKNNIHSLRSVEACGRHVRSKAPEARYFFFREEGNYHCASCPLKYNGHPTTGTGYQNSRIYTYRILNWRPPAWLKKYQRIVKGRYCTGYKKTSTKFRDLPSCARWVRQVDREARFFFFRHQSNWHCSPCPWNYNGSRTTGTAASNTRIYIYRIVGWTRPTYGW